MTWEWVNNYRICIFSLNTDSLLQSCETTYYADSHCKFLTFSSFNVRFSVKMYRFIKVRYGLTLFVSALLEWQLCTEWDTIERQTLGLFQSCSHSEMLSSCNSTPVVPHLSPSPEESVKPLQLVRKEALSRAVCIVPGGPPNMSLCVSHWAL